MEKIVIGPYTKGLNTKFTPFNLDNTAFPALLNAYQWRDRIRRKRGTQFVSRLERHFDSTSTSYSDSSTIALSSGAANLLTDFSLQTNGNIVPGTVTITLDPAGAATVYTDDSAGALTGGSGGTINYATGAITITGGGSSSINAVFNYYPDLPVMGLETFDDTTTAFPKSVNFDTVYSYETDTDSGSAAVPHRSRNVSFYKNLATSGTYTQKSTWTPLSWNGENYQQFGSANYQDALFVTNGVTVPFSQTNIGMPYLPPASITSATRTAATTVDFVIPSTNLVVGDYVFANEFSGGARSEINFQTGYVTNVAGTTYTVTFPNASISASGLTPGLLIYLTNREGSTLDCIRWYDGDPTNGNPSSPTFATGNGWVNFVPPLSQGDIAIANLVADQYYLVGAKILLPFKDRMIALGPVVQNAAGQKFYLQDTIIYSEVGTVYYTASFQGDPVVPTNTPTSLLTPTNRGSVAAAWFTDQPGFGGFLTLGLNQAINSADYSEDVLILGLENSQVRLVFTGNDIFPFQAYLIDTQFGTSSTHSTIVLDDAIISRGNTGIVATSQTQCQRIDQDIADEVFQFNLRNNGAERVTSGKDFINQWFYMSYKGNQSNTTVFPDKTLFYNYDSNTWAMFDAAYTHYGFFRVTSAVSWSKLPYVSWRSWTAPWSAGISTIDQPYMIAGNQQGFIVRPGVGTQESDSLYIRDFSGSIVTCPNHGLKDLDYIYIEDCIGTISSEVNNKSFSVDVKTADTFELRNTITTGTYLGGGVIRRLYQPFIQTKQFPTAWQDARATRIGVQRYLLTTTNSGRVTLLIYLNQNATDAYNDGPLLPDPTTTNTGLIFSTVLYTCPETTNLGLTAFNSNLQQQSGAQSARFWHRVSQSMIGDTVQFAITLNDAQMLELDANDNPSYAFDEIELHGAILDVYPSRMLI